MNRILINKKNPWTLISTFLRFIIHTSESEIKMARVAVSFGSQDQNLPQAKRAQIIPVARPANVNRKAISKEIFRSFLVILESFSININRPIFLAAIKEKI